MQKAKMALLVAGFIISLNSLGQVSVGFQYGYVSCSDKQDNYALNASWPSSSNSGGDNSLVFFSGGTGTSWLATLGYDFTKHFSAFVQYRSIAMKVPAEHREGTVNSMGIILRVNFIDIDKKVVPFFQGEYMFLNSSTLKQTGATSTEKPGQVSPSFENSSSTSLGIGGDLGVEIKLSQPVALVITAGYHGVKLVDDDTFVQSLDYGSYLSPHNLDGMFFIQANAGLKYYFGKAKKQRDF